ncbi:RNA polymerase sigma factor [uncultured Kordia sp.]|uniref:RNA polymerase sigma factor n=1 Tax=uncultured Kordia sp. TaxID=507699 RepID=UPI0026047552|nr:RNA polymerase sigma factor [uncultured Kordia sp.]
MACSQELEDILNRGYRYALSLTKDTDDAFDLVQSSYLKVIEKQKTVVISYLITTIRNQYIDTKRKEKLKFNWRIKFKKEESYEPLFTTEPILEKALSELSDRNREIIFLSTVEEYTAQEISDLLQIPRGTILSILHRTKQKLKEQLQETTV